MRIVLAMALALGFTSRATAFSEADRGAVQSVIGRQLEAFVADDSAGAYAFASPGIKAQFPTAEIFMELVRQGYQPVYRSRSHAFGRLEETPRGLEQTVELVDAAGEFWTAVYTLQRQPDGSWKIAACRLIKQPGEVA